MSEHLTDAVVRQLPTPATGNKITWDDSSSGFGVRVTAADARSFILSYRLPSGRERRFTVGRFPDWKTKEARDEADRLRRLIKKEGVDPLADKRAEREASTVADLCDRFVLEHLPGLRASTAAEYRSMLSKYIRPHFGSHTKVAEVGFSDVEKLHRKITAAGAPYRANRVASVLSKMFALSVNWGMRDDNPVKKGDEGIKRNHEKRRRRYLRGDELGRLLAALAAHPDKEATDIIRLLLLTGSRRGEILGMRWGDVDVGTGVWTKLAENVKQDTDHIVPLSAPARQLLSEIRTRQRQASPHKPLGTYVFAGAGSKAHIGSIEREWRQLCRAAGINGLAGSIDRLRLHDLRHSFASQLVSSGHSLEMIGSLLGHSNPATTKRYSHLYDDAQRKAVESVAAAIEAAAGNSDKPAAVVSTLRRRPRLGR
jgi:integrase